MTEDVDRGCRQTSVSTTGVCSHFNYLRCTSPCKLHKCLSTLQSRSSNNTAHQHITRQIPYNLQRTDKQNPASTNNKRNECRLVSMYTCTIEMHDAKCSSVQHSIEHTTAVSMKYEHTFAAGMFWSEDRRQVVQSKVVVVVV